MMPNEQPAPVGRTLGGARTGPAIPAPMGRGADMQAQGPMVMMAIRAALARAIAARQRGVRRGR
jgi:hypothetical protein